MSTPIASIVIPAHDEERTIGRLLAQLTTGAAAGELDIVVVCNGCADRTADAAAAHGPAVRVVEVAEPSKRDALRTGDEHTGVFPRFYVDADVELRLADVREMVHVLRFGGVLACSPERRLSRTGVSLLARLYYDVWERLPQVRTGLFGRGVVAVTEAGYQRISGLPKVLSDDLAMSEAFAPDERCIVATAEVVVHPARTLRDLTRRRVRVAAGNREAEQLNLRSPASRTTVRGLVRLAMADRAVALGLPVFLAVTAVSRRLSRRQVRSGDVQTWHRDESSRAAG